MIKSDLAQDQLKMKDYIAELERFGYREKLDEKVKIQCDKRQQIGHFLILLDTKFKIYEVYIWEDN